MPRLRRYGNGEGSGSHKATQRSCHVKTLPPPKKKVLKDESRHDNALVLRSRFQFHLVSRVVQETVEEYASRGVRQPFWPMANSIQVLLVVLLPVFFGLCLCACKCISALKKMHLYSCRFCLLASSLILAVIPKSVTNPHAIIMSDTRETYLDLASEPLLSAFSSWASRLAMRLLRETASCSLAVISALAAARSRSAVSARAWAVSASARRPASFYSRK